MSVKKVETTKYIGQEEHAGFEFLFEPIEKTITIEKTKAGYIVKYLAQDDSGFSPEENYDVGLFLVGYHSDFTVTHNNKIPEDLARCIANKGKWEDESVDEEAKEYIEKYFIFKLEAYIHSGVSLSLSKEGNFPDRRWDVSQLGLVFVSKEECDNKVKARKLALALIEEWNNYLSGEVYGLVRENFNEKKNRIDGEECWGYNGYKNALEALKTVI